MATNGTKIKDSSHLSSPSSEVKLPVSDGSGTPKHITMADVKSYCIGEGTIITNLVTLTLAEYNALETKSDTTLYLIKADSQEITE